MIIIILVVIIPHMQLLWGINAALFPIVPKKIKQMVKMTQGILYGHGMHTLKN